jgi:hypothetical protein
MAHYSMPYLPKVEWHPVEELAYSVARSLLSRAYNRGNKAKRK